MRADDGSNEKPRAEVDDGIRVDAAKHGAAAGGPEPGHETGREKNPVPCDGQTSKLKSDSVHYGHSIRER